MNNTQLLNEYSSSSTKSRQPVGKPKIYLNPNFKKSVFPCLQNDCDQRKKTPANINCENTIVHPGISSFDKKITRLKICQENEESNHQISNEPANSHLEKKMQKIYVNQHFTKRVGEEDNYCSKPVHQKLSNFSLGVGSSCKNMSPTFCQLRNCPNTEGVSIEMKSRDEILSSGVLKKPIIYVKEDIKTKESLRLENNIEHQTSSSTMPSKKIFLNPTLKKIQSVSKASVGNSSRNDLTAYETCTSQGKNIEHSCLNSLTRDIIVEGNQKNLSIESNTTLLSPDCGQFLTVHSKRGVGQRTRTSSTCLVSVSATKVVRRRKSNLKIEPNNITSSPNKFLFLSKTKNGNAKDCKSLVKYKFVKNDLNLKNKLKSLVNKNNLQRLTPDKLNKLNRQSLVSSDLNMVSVPTTRYVTKIKTNNGKSLQLITSNKESSACVKPSIVTSTSTQPLFISKTKLVRKSVMRTDMNNGKATMKNTTRSDIVLKSKTKLVSPNSHLHYLTHQKINYQRKQNALCSRTLSNNVSKLACVTKIRSNNGKSLKLVQNTEMPQRNLTSTSSVLKRKELLRQQMNKNMMCMIKSKSRKSQFSKINVSVKKTSSQSPCHCKYVYKSKDLISKRQLTKAAILKRRGSLVQASLSTDKTKYIKSKYNLIRKYSYHNSSALKGNPDIPTSKIESRSKMKWRKINTLSKSHSKR